MKATEKAFWQGWACLAAFIAGTHDRPELIDYAAKEHGVTGKILKEAQIDVEDKENLRGTLLYEETTK